MTATHPTRPGPVLSLEPRQLLLLALCIVGLVAAAFAAPATVEAPDRQEVGTETNCRVTVEDRPVPGTEVGVIVRREGRAVADAPVWFNGERIGRTDESGRVTGEVPFARQLRISAALASGASCEFETGTVSRTGSGADLAAASIAGSGDAQSVTTRPLAAGGGQTADGPNVRGSVPVHGNIDVEVDGEPYPGRTVTVRAAIEGDPVPRAAVRVDGDQVGTTDEEGRLDVTLPERGREVTVAVQRGELVSEETIDLLVPTVSVRGTSWLPIPGERAVAEVGAGDGPATDAVVSLDGERVGTTGPDGEVSFSLPIDPTTRVTARTDIGTASTSVLVAFAPTVVAALVAFVVLVVVPLAVYWAGGKRVLAGFGSAVSVVLAAFVGYRLAGRVGGVVAFAALVGLLTVAFAVFRPSRANAVAQTAGERAQGAAEWVAVQVLWTASGIETVIDLVRHRGRGIADRVQDDDRSLIAGVRSWIVRIPGRFVAVLLAVLGAPGRILAGGDTDAGSSEGADATGERETATASDESAPPIRDLWRRFARTVTPSRWPRRTPGEVSRRAIEAGLPTDPVVELTDVFRDVEYGDRPLSRERYERARAAFDDLDLESDGEGSTDDRTDDDGGTAA